MAVKTYSLRTQGDLALSKNFTVREFACKDGSDKVLIDSVCVGWLQACRDFFGVRVIIGSGYRTPTYNDVIGGADESHHTTGRADDFDVGSTGPIGTIGLIHPRLVAMFLESLTPRPGGIGLYVYPDGKNWVHVDSGPQGKYWFAAAPNAGYQYFNSFLPIIKPMTSNWQFMFEVEVAQKMLSKLGYYHGIVDGKFGEVSSKAVSAFQKSKGLTIDGKLGPQTFKALFKAVGHWVE